MPRRARGKQESRSRKRLFLCASGLHLPVDQIPQLHGLRHCPARELQMLEAGAVQKSCFRDVFGQFTNADVDCSNVLEVRGANQKVHDPDGGAETEIAQSNVGKDVMIAKSAS